ncbi:MAG: hypothetical protein KDE34_13440 [Anaerolineales bacterium]|nr:hypothetical protein [Anaerolineales bacterium]
MREGVVTVMWVPGSFDDALMELRRYRELIATVAVIWFVRNIHGLSEEKSDDLFLLKNWRKSRKSVPLSQQFITIYLYPKWPKIGPWLN